jgi:hypothetical protein
MSINLVSLITQFLTPDVIARIAAALGADKTAVGKAVSAAVPGILGGLTGVASTPEGARKLFDRATMQSPSVLDDLAGLIGGSGQKALMDNGTSVLSSLIGGSALSGLAGAVGKYAGLGGSASSSLLGLLAPVIMGALAKQKVAGGLDASGLASMLASQKSNVLAALPSGASDLLRSTGLLATLGEGVGSAAQSVRSAAQPAAATAGRAATRAPSGMPGWALWLVPLVAVLALGSWFLGRHAPTAVEQTKTAATETAQGVADQAKQTANQAGQPAQAVADQSSAAVAQALQSLQDVKVGSVNVGPTMQSVIAEVNDSLKTITNVDSANAALPKLQDTVAQLDNVSGVLDQMPAGSRSALATLINSIRPALEELFTKVLAISGVAEIAKPVIDTIRTKLDALAKT